MTSKEREEVIEVIKAYRDKLTHSVSNQLDGDIEAFDAAIEALEDPCRDMEEIREVMSCDVDAETKCKMISNILTTKPHYFEKQMQEPILDKIKAEIDLETRIQVKHYTNTDAVIDAVLDVIDKYKVESEDGI